MTWFVRPKMPSVPAHGLIGNMSWRRRPLQIAASFKVPSRSGWPASHAALMAPTDVPSRKSGWMPASISAWSIPTWIAPRLLPPDSTNAVLRWRAAGRLIAMFESGAISSSLFIGQPCGALGAKSFDHHGGVDAIPQSPVGLRTPYLVEQRFELAVQVGVC